jgi:hypothetical protein
MNTRYAPALMNPTIAGYGAPKPDSLPIAKIAEHKKGGCKPR